MTWQTPKVDWNANYDEAGRYTGDYFNAIDYNRIKNNLCFLRNMAVEMYNSFEIKDMGEDKGYQDYLYADEINRIENNLDILAKNTLRKDYGAIPEYTDNGRFLDFGELNRIEGAILDMYSQLKGQHEGRRKLTFMLGIREVF